MIKSRNLDYLPQEIAQVTNNLETIIVFWIFPSIKREYFHRTKDLFHFIFAQMLNFIRIQVWLFSE